MRHALFSLLEAAALTVLLIAGLRYIVDIPQQFDVGLADAAAYLAAGVQLPQKGLPGAAAGPLYAVWYYLLSLLQPDRVRLYYLNYQILTLALPLALYVLLRALQVRRMPALVLGCFCLIAFMNVQIWPKPSHLAVLLVLCSSVPLVRSRSVCGALGWGCLGALFAAYVRPEYFFTFLMIAGGYMYVLFRRRRGGLGRSAMVGALCLLILSVSCFAFIGLPLSGDRSMMAFGQHFARNWVLWSGSDLNPYSDWQQVKALVFGPVDSVAGAFWARPAAVLHHMGCNALYAVRHMLFLLFSHRTLLPSSYVWAEPLERYALMFGCGLLLVCSRRWWRAGFAGRCNKNRVFLFVGACYAATAVLCALCIYPRSHYLLVVVVITWCVTALMATPSPDAAKQSGAAVQLAVMAALLLLCVRRPAVCAVPARDNAAVISFLQGLAIAAPVQMLEAGGYAVYAGDNYHSIPYYSKQEGFQRFVQKRDINLIIASTALRQDRRYRQDAAWQGFITACADYEFVRRAIPGSADTAYIKTELLKTRRTKRKTHADRQHEKKH